MNEITTAGIILNSMSMGENDRRVEILTADLGRIGAFARGSRKPGSSLGAATRVFAFGQFTLAKGKSAYNIRNADISNYFEQLALDYDQACYGFYFLEVSRYFSRENAESEQMLKLLYFSLRALSLESISKRLVRSVFELKTLIINGLCPAYDRIFSRDSTYAFAVNAASGARRAFQYVWTAEIEKLYTFVLTDRAMDDFETIAGRLMEISTDTRFKSLSLIS